VCIGKTYRLTEATDIIQRNFAYAHSILSGRTPWTKILSETFGDAFADLIKNHQMVFATALGACARLLQSIVLVECKFSEQLTTRWRSRLLKSFERGYMQNIIEQFPEVTGLKVHAEKVAAQLSVVDAIASYEQAAKWLGASYNSFFCNSISSSARPRGICYRTLVEAILSLGTFVSEMEVEKDLFPKRAGIMEFYQRQLGSRKWNHDPHILEEFGPFAFLLAQQLEHATAGSLVISLQLLLATSRLTILKTTMWQVVPMEFARIAISSLMSLMTLALLGGSALSLE
jgi:hypothetical protein